MKAEHETYFTPFRSDISKITLPERFTFPFYYAPHPITKVASEELQAYIETQQFEHNFGLQKDASGPVIGKMFGVLVVKNLKGELGYFSAFSGKLGNENHHAGFVPTVYDMLTEDGFFNPGKIEISKITEDLEQKQKGKDYLALKEALDQTKKEAEQSIENYRQFMREAKKQRKIKRTEGENLSTEELAQLKDELIKESLHHKHQLRVLQKEWKQRVINSENQLAPLQEEIDQLKKIRSNKSNNLQKRLFEEYVFLNKNGVYKSLLDIFEPTIHKVPPSGAGECAAPKLLHFAYKHGYQPIAMAEFWWGASPRSEIKQHKNYYPSCRGKCEPILGHMLEGLNVDPNPMLNDNFEDKSLEIIYEDEDIIAVNKPADFLSVPGKTIKDSVYQRIKDQYPEATGPLIVHRLDMATSGILLLAKTKESNAALQEQFINRTVSKCYVALLDGEIEQDEGYIELPLRLDINDRPRQLVCFKHGKPAKTKFKVIERKNGKTKIHFFPITGRTHQLRMHAAHQDGLNTPICGDDLYGKVSNRLYLHAEKIEFTHPKTGKKFKIKCESGF